MHKTFQRAAAAAACLPLLLALAACGDRVDNTGLQQPAHANVEINRQGMEGARDSGVGVVNQGEPQREKRRWRWFG